jgi:uncharacterized protein (DUF2252 family)
VSQTKKTPSPPTAVLVTEPGAKRYVNTGNVPHLSVEERVARGKAARKEVPREAHALYEPANRRPDPIKLLQSQGTTRVKELVPIRYGRMLVSPFTFYRGAALIMASDLDATPRSGFKVQVCGDAHLTNFGIFASPERRQIFDINDFDETLPGPWEWDVKRLTASLVVAGRNNGFSAKETRRVVTDSVKQYRDSMRTYAKLGNLDVWYSHLEVSDVMSRLRGLIPDAKRMRRVEGVVAKARTRDSMQAMDKLTQIVDGEPRIVGDPPLIVPVEDLLPDVQKEELEETIRSLFHAYRRTLASDRRELLEQFRYVQLARKVVGVGSVGTRAWIALFLGRDNRDPLFLQVKEAQASVLEDYVGKSQYSNSGQRVVAGQRLMQAASDIFLGWQRVLGIDGIERDFYVRQLRDWKGSMDVEQMIPEGMALYGRVCAWTLARAHARSGDRIAIASYLGGGIVFDQAIADFSEAYADQNERDYEVFSDAVESGKLKAETGL